MDLQKSWGLLNYGVSNHPPRASDGVICGRERDCGQEVGCEVERRGARAARSSGGYGDACMFTDKIVIVLCLARFVGEWATTLWRTHGVGVHDRDYLLTDIGVVAELRLQIGHPSVRRRANHGPLEIELRLGDGGLVQVYTRLALAQRAFRLLINVCRGPALSRESALPAFVGAGIVERGGEALPRRR